MCDIVWISPQSHSSLSVKPHFLRHALQWPWPVRKQFSSDHWRLWRSKPGSLSDFPVLIFTDVGSTTKVELTTVADCQSSFHRLVTSIVCICKSLHSGLRQLCVIPDEVEEGERRHHIMANHGDIQPALSTCLWQLCVAELVVQYLWERATIVMELTGRCQRWGAWRNVVGHLQG